MPNKLNMTGPVEWSGIEAPEDHELAWRAVHPDGRSRNGFRWPFKGVSSVPAQWVCRENTGPCPRREGDGLCLAKTFDGAASGGITAITGLIVAYRLKDVLGEDSDKLRVQRCKVLDVIDIPRLIREGCATNANLTRANLSGADLTRANLTGANLYGANLTRANLSGADLTRANLYGAILGGANLDRADLSRADLTGANLYGANLTRANLSGANLDRADLRRADLCEADLRGAILRGADLTGADLTGTRGYRDA
jgi:uncharacterized protein YjbI with pentapeptide repeats